MLELRTPLLTQVRRTTLNTVPVITRLAALRDAWIREPESWRPHLNLCPRELLVSLIEHLLLRYPLPRFCVNAWFIDGPLAHVERKWYVHIAQGGNLRTFPEWVPHLTKRASHEFLGAPDHFLLREAVRFGQANAIFQNPELAKAIAKSRIGLDFHHDDLWLPFLQKWASNGGNDDELFLVADYLSALTLEKTVSDIAIEGRTVDSLVKSATRFFRDLAKTESNRTEGNLDPAVIDQMVHSDRNFLLDQLRNSWEPLEGVVPFQSERFGWQWEIKELTSPQELTDEGRDMAHCVGDYGWYCRRGFSSIFSLRSGEMGKPNLDREITIEVLKRSRVLLQARAWQNRRPHRHSRRIILEWCRRNAINPGAWLLW